jgi:hypothetical protein
MSAWSIPYQTRQGQSREGQIARALQPVDAPRAPRTGCCRSRQRRQGHNQEKEIDRASLTSVVVRVPNDEGGNQHGGRRPGRLVRGSRAFWPNSQTQQTGDTDQQGCQGPGQVDRFTRPLCSNAGFTRSRWFQDLLGPYPSRRIAYHEDQQETERYEAEHREHADGYAGTSPQTH